MKNLKKRLISLIIVLAMTTSGFGIIPASWNAAFTTVAGAASDDLVVVSLGDSYSSGEGLEPFYGQDKATADKVADLDWLAHRSQSAWPGRLKFDRDTNPVSEYKDSESGNKWYFVASSGAKIENLSGTQTKTYNHKSSGDSDYTTGTASLPPQLSVFDTIPQGTVDYVTVTIGGNDVDFSGLVEAAISPLASPSLDTRIETARDELSKTGGIKEQLKQSYKDIAEKAGAQAKILVVGYPTLLSSSGSGSTELVLRFSAENCQKINQAVKEFNAEIKNEVDECKDDGLNIEYIDVQEAFASHEAYTADAYINPLYGGSKAEDLDSTKKVNKFQVSDYSMHPNEAGSAAYAEIVQNYIDTNISGIACIDRTWNEETKTVDEQTMIINEFTTLTKDTANLTEGTYVLNSNVTYSQRITVESGNVNIILCNDCTLENSKGINVKEGATLTVYGQSGDSGKLIAKNSIGAGIGALDEAKAGNIIIKGGNIKANGGGKDAGIGGGKGSSGFESIEIYGGTVNASGGKSGAGIGRGKENSDSDCGPITIYGGDIYAKGGSEAAGIGGGEHSNGGVITINGGTVKSHGGGIIERQDSDNYYYDHYDSGAAIGGGDGANGGTITINGGVVYAYGDGEGTGIGGGDCGDSGNITINGGIVRAEGFNDGAAIGGGEDGNVNSITINGGDVKAVINSPDNVDVGGAAIGSGDGEDMDGTITINGGRVIAASYYGAAIGSGSQGDQDGDITITGGEVYARSGVYYYNKTEHYKTLIPFDDVTPETVLTLPYMSEYGAAGIGGGRYGNQNGKVTIKGECYVLAVGSNYNTSGGGGAGIGGGCEEGALKSDGGESTGAFTIGSGAVVEIYAGNESEPLGHGEDGSDKGKIYLDDNYCVYDYNIGAFATASKRNWFCRNKKHHILIAPCEHPDCSYTYIDLDSHSWQCKNCLSSGTEAHQNNDASSCELCTGTKPIKQVFVYEGVTGDNSGDKPFVYRITLSDVLEGTDFRLPEPSGESPYYVFEGYKVISGYNDSDQSAVLRDWQAVNTDELMQPGDLITVTDSTAVRAQYKECYTVTFDANGGVGTMNSVIVPKGEAYELPEGIFERDDERVFTYWQLNGERKDAGTPITVNSDITLYAQYDYPVHEHDGVVFTPTNSHLAIESTAGNYYLVDNDVYLPQTLPEGNTTICLNGHDLYLNFDAIRGLDIPAGSTLTIINDKGKGNIIVNIYQNGAQVNNCTAITVHGTLNLRDVDITGFNNIRTTLGGAVCVADGGTFNMDGGEISGNRSQTHGAGVYVANGGTFNVSGTVDISDNVYTGGSEEVPENVYLENGAVINVTGTLGEDAELGVTCENATHKTVITNGLSGKGGVENFVSDDESVFIVANESGEAMLRAPLTITVEPTVNGTAEAPATAYAGDTVTLTVTPDEMYKVISVTVNGTAITPDGDAYSFVMPEENVTVAATFDFADGIGTKLAGHSISLDGDIGVNFYMELGADTADSDTAYMHFTIPTGSSTSEQRILVKDARRVEAGAKTYYVFKCQVAAKEMTSQIKAQIIDGENLGTEYTYSVKDYADYLLNHTEDNEEYANAAPLVKAMLNYGAYSQIYFDKNPTDLANANLTDDEKTLGDVSIDIADPVIDNLPDGVTYEGATLSLKSETTLSLYFKSNTELEFSCNGYTVEKATSGDYQIARIRGIKAKNIGDVFSLNVNGTTVTYSPLNYCKNVLTPSTVTADGAEPQDEKLVNVVKALYLYWQAANSYFD